MKPRTKLHRTLLKYSQKLPPLSEYQVKDAIKKVAPHMAKLNSKKQYVCLDCGHSWTGDEAESVVCPSCGTKLEVSKERKWNYCDKAYVAVVCKCHGYQVVRMFFMQTNLRRGEKATYWIQEAFQRWIDPKGKTTIIGRARVWISHYCDQWNWDSDMEIRTESYGHSVTPYKIIGKTSLIPELIRNGLTSDFHDCDPSELCIKLLTDNKIESAWKMGQYKIVDCANSRWSQFAKFWNSIRIATKHHYFIQDATMWYDTLEALEYLGKDIRNPKYICPENLVEAHDHWIEKQREKRERDEIIRKENEFKKNLELAAEKEKAYKEAKAKFFDLEFKDHELIVKPLTSVKEFVEEGHLHHHCVYTMGYYKRPDTLILHAMIEGVSIATIELSLTNFSIVQCRGKFNKVPPMNDRIQSLIKANISKIMQKCAA